MINMAAEWEPILKALIAAPVAWQSPKDISLALGQDLDKTTDLLCVMDEGGWVSVWDVTPDPLITLSTLAAHRLEVVLVEVGPDEVPRWAPAGDPAPALPRASNVASTELHASQDKIVSPEISPDLAAERSERLEKRAAGIRLDPPRGLQVEDLPLPILILGQGLTPWPGPSEFTIGDLCPACGDRPLLPHAYCLCCNRWGLDELAELLQARCRPRNGSSRPATPNESTENESTENESTENESTENESASVPRGLHPAVRDERLRVQEQIVRNRARRKARREARKGMPIGQR